MTRKSKPTAASKLSEPSSKAAKSKSGEKRDTRTSQEKFADSIRTSAQRETVEAFVVAFILALLFRAFVAEAFVIPTGSMAPTLMGAHKDVFCEQCNHRFQVGASKERRGPKQEYTVVAGICPNCRFVNNMDLADDNEDSTFNGDRILVSKFAYTVSDPDRWDVIVFKFPGNPKQNYIKRLVGLPNETVSIQYGDVYIAESGQAESTILRKPADKLLAMRHHVYDTGQQSDLLIQSGYPSRIQPWAENTTAPPTDSWQIERSKENGLTASVQPSDASQTHWLRYFHRWPSEVQWQNAADGNALNMVDPYSSRLITDYYAYDCYITVPSDRVYENDPSNARWAGKPPFTDSYDSGGSLSQFGSRAQYGDRNLADDGLHWVGDLIVESEVAPASDCKELLLELVEAGVQYQCRIDLKSGDAELSILDQGTQRSFGTGSEKGNSIVQGKTTARAGNTFSVRFSNCDDELLLWIDDQLVEFDGPTTFQSKSYRPDEDNFPRYREGVHPMDAAPFGIAVTGGAATINRIKLDRDKYYVASDNSSFGIFDYDLNSLYHIADRNVSLRDIQELMSRPDLWEEFPAWQTRRKVVFQLGEDQFFPMGDNSPESLDARCWAGTKRIERLPDRFRDQAYAFADASYVPRDLLVGKALMVFWPHPWKSPVPFTPNFNRFRLIR